MKNISDWCHKIINAIALLNANHAKERRRAPSEYVLPLPHLDYKIKILNDKRNQIRAGIF